MNSLYSFVYRGILAEEALDKVGRSRRKYLGLDGVKAIQDSLSFDLLDNEKIQDAQKMSIVYTAIHAFENSVRDLVSKAMVEYHGGDWWNNTPSRIQEKVKKRIEDEAKFKWHGSRGGDSISYCDFGDLSAIIVTNWDAFSDVLSDMEWVKAILSALEKSRNILMHGGLLGKEDIARIGVHIRDWIRQAG